MLQDGIDYYAISPKTGTSPTVFVSEIAGTRQGAVEAAGSAKQVIVPIGVDGQRLGWSTPIRFSEFERPMNKYQLLRQRAEEFHRVLDEYAIRDPDIADFRRRFIPWYERIRRKEIRLPCYDYKLGAYISNPDLSPLAERYCLGQPPNPLSIAEANFGNAICDMYSGPRYLEMMAAAGKTPTVTLDEPSP